MDVEKPSGVEVTCQGLQDNEALWTCAVHRKWSYANAAVDESSPEAGRLQVRVFLRAGHLDAPHLFPGVVQLHVDRVDARVVGCHGVAHIGGDSVFLQIEKRRGVRAQERSPHSQSRFCSFKKNIEARLRKFGNWRPPWWKYGAAQRNILKVYNFKHIPLKRLIKYVVFSSDIRELSHLLKTHEQQLSLYDFCPWIIFISRNGATGNRLVDQRLPHIVRDSTVSSWCVGNFLRPRFQLGLTVAVIQWGSLSLHCDHKQ